MATVRREVKIKYSNSGWIIKVNVSNENSCGSASIKNNTAKTIETPAITALAYTHVLLKGYSRILFSLVSEETEHTVITSHHKTEGLGCLGDASLLNRERQLHVLGTVP